MPDIWTCFHAKMSHAILKPDKERNWFSCKTPTLEENGCRTNTNGGRNRSFEALAASMRNKLYRSISFHIFPSSPQTSCLQRNHSHKLLVYNGRITEQERTKQSFSPCLAPTKKPYNAVLFHFCPAKKITSGSEWD